MLKLRNLIFGLFAFSLLPASSGFADELNIYSYRKPNLLEPFLTAYTAKTGVKFNVHAPKGLVQRLKSEGAGSPADLVLTVDVSRIAELAKAELLAPISSSVIDAKVPKTCGLKTWIGQHYHCVHVSL